MNTAMLQITDLTVKVGNKLILKDFSLNIDSGEVHVLLGPNGAGKTTLIKTLLGFKNYKVVKGEIKFKGVDITDMPTHERVRLGIGVLFQHPPEINGVKLVKLLDVCGQKRSTAINYDSHRTNKVKVELDRETSENKASENKASENACDSENTERIIELAKRLNLDESYLNRDVNVGFSGGEVKRSEILQMMVLQPDLLLFDEPDSGVDVENVELIAGIMRELLDRNKIPSQQKKSGLIITHLGYILKFLGHITRAHIMMDGSIQCSGDPQTIINTIMKRGFDGCKNCLACSTPSLPSSEEVNLL